MATGTAPALDPKKAEQQETQKASESKLPVPLTFIARIGRKLIEIFEHNERLGVTRP